MEQAKTIMDKMCKVIDSATPEQAEVVRRYVSLANRRLHGIYGQCYDWSIIGGSTAIAKRFEKKFGPFRPMNESVILSIGNNNV